jgi:hypothetical protein
MQTQVRAGGGVKSFLYNHCVNICGFCIGILGLTYTVIGLRLGGIAIEAAQDSVAEAQTANRFAYYALESANLANRLALMQLCEQNRVSTLSSMVESGLDARTRTKDRHHRLTFFD